MTENMKCNRCGKKTQKSGTRTYVSGIHQMYRCTGCGHQFRGEFVQPGTKPATVMNIRGAIEK